MRLVGIDLATTPRSTGVYVLEDHAILHVGIGAGTARHPSWLVDRCAGANVVAIDVPFGWPKPFTEALAGYRVGDRLSLERNQYRLRKTDFWLKEKFPPLNPIAVATDKLGSTAIVGANLVHALRERGFYLAPASVMTPAAVEVYPAASLRAWGLPHKNLDVPGVLDRICEAFDLSIGDQELRRVVGCRHCFDALLSSLTAREYADGLTFDPPEELSDDVLNIEGWIRVPSRGLGGTRPGGT
jgi:predicted nuclease with RNAse H fold